MANKERISVFLAIFFPIILGAFFLCKPNFLEIKRPVFNNATTTIEENDTSSVSAGQIEETPKNIEDEIMAKKLALEKADSAKGLYINRYAASAQNSAVQENIKKLLAETELNSVVIDVKEAEGPFMPGAMKKFISDLHKDNIWVIARICVFRDSSLIEEKPEWYLKYNSTSSAIGSFATTSEFWKDSGGEYWLDPASPGVQNYIIDFSKKVIDFGFDELQFDYVRFPSDGQVGAIIYPFYDSGKNSKFEIMNDFFSRLSDSLRAYSYSTILSADLFGYIATQYQSGEIGQRLSDAAGFFDYISFMLYPSHFYGGFSVPEDSKRELPAIYFPYNATNTEKVASNHPYEVVFRSIISASDYLIKLKSQTKIRPWLQDFNLKLDTDRGIYYDAQKVKAQIQAAEDAGAAGWLLWNPSNIYTADALSPD